MATVDAGAAAIAGLVLTGRILVKLVEKKYLTIDEANQMIATTANELAAGDPATNAAGRAALKAVFPNAPI